MGVSITRIVKFIRKGERGNSVINAVTSIRRYTLATWQRIGATNYAFVWVNISNYADMKIGDTMVIQGVVTDKDDISVTYYGTITAINATSVQTIATALIMSGTNGSSFAAQYSVDGSTNWHNTFTDGDIYMRTSADGGKTWSAAIKIVGEKGGETNYQFAWSSHKSLDDSEDPLSDVEDWYDYPPAQTDASKPYLWTMITTPDNKVSYARLTGEKGDKGDNGKDAVTIYVDPNTILHKKAASNSTYAVTVKLKEGEKYIDYGTNYGQFVASTPNYSAVSNGLACIIVLFSDSIRYDFTIKANAEVNLEAKIKISYKGFDYWRSIPIKTVANGDKGDKGDRGPALRGPQMWNDFGVGYVFQSGADGEEYKDVVLYGGYYYSCIKSHTKTASNYPGSATDTNSGLWKLADPVEIVATKILLTQYALVKNLGVETIDMKDDKGNIIFQAKDGNVTCNSGTFNNIKVTGNSEFSGTMKAVSGSFKSLNCVDDSGKVVGNIAFGSDGRMWFDGDMYSQGYRNDKQRSNRFYASDILCRGMFGHREKITAVVKGSYMYVYSKGADQSGTYVSLKTGKTSNNKTFYYIPLYSPSDADDISGLPIDVVVFNTSSDYYYAFSGMGNGKEWRVINGNNNQTVHFCDISGWHELVGGESTSCIYVNPEWLSPVPDKSDIARGVFWSGEMDLNW